MGIWVYFLIGWITLWWLLAQLYFPNGYSVFNDFISAMGNPNKNPDGHLFFDVGTFIAGVLIIPFFYYLKAKLNVNKFGLIYVIAGIIGCAGFMLVGCFPEYTSGYHEFAAIMAFGGFSVSAFFLLIDLIRKKKWSTVVSIYWIYITLLIMMFIVPYISGIYKYPYKSGELFSPLQEWIFMVNIVFWLINLYIFI